MLQALLLQGCYSKTITVCLPGYLGMLWTLQWRAVGNWLTHSDAALPLKLLLVWRKTEVWGWEIYPSAQKGSFEKDSSLLPEN